jgi:hypothetical protein
VLKMVSDTVLAGIVGVVGTASGALIGLLAEPVRGYFAQRARLNQLRRIVYGELLVKLHQTFTKIDNVSLQVPLPGKMKFFH